MRGGWYTDTDLATVSWYARKNCLYSSLLASVISLHIRFMFLHTGAVMSLVLVLCCTCGGC